MKAKLPVLLAFGLIASSGALMAEDPAPQPKPPAPASRPALPASERLKQYDTNGNGVLDPEERVALQKQAVERRAELIKQFDKDGDGKLSREEQQAVWASRGVTNTPALLQQREAYQEMLKKYDANGNGQLEPSERREAAKTLREQRRQAAEAMEKPAEPKPASK